ncbi:MAG: biopolymer transport protein ExbD [Lentisphaeria bacterium]|jgi:biopolymer transport protein ExbD
MKLARKRKRMEDTVELNITAFMNLMVILVPFLLITAVFTRMTVLELNLPALNASKAERQEIKLQLQIVVKPDALIVQDGILGVIKVISRLENGLPIADAQRFIWKPLADILIEIKSRFPQEQGIALLLDRSVDYKTMIEVMDHVRSADIVQAATLETVELFPQVSIGDAPEIEPNSSASLPDTEVGVSH